MRFNNGYAERFKGTAQVFSTPSVTPYFITLHHQYGAVLPGALRSERGFADDGTTRTNITGTPPAGAIDNRWTGGSVNGVLVLEQRCRSAHVLGRYGHTPPR